MPNISRSKGNQTKKYCQLIRYNKINIFLQKSRRKRGRETSSRPLCFFKESLIRGYSKITLNLACNKKKLSKILYYGSRDMFHFDFLETGLGKVSRSHFVYDFSRKMFLTLYSIKWPNVIVWLPLLLQILGNICIATVC